MKKKRKISIIVGGIAVLLLFVMAAGAYFLTDFLVKDTALKNWINLCFLIFVSVAALAMIVFTVVAALIDNNRIMLKETLRDETRPILSYLGRVLTKTEASQPRAEAIINNMMLNVGTSKNVKMNLDTTKSNIIPYEGIVEDKMGEAVVIIRPFMFANYGKSIAVGLTFALDDAILSYRSDYVIEPNAKVQLEINDTIKFSKNMKFFTMSYYDIYGNEFSVKLDGIVEYAEDESRGLDRDVYFFYVEGFSEK